MLEGPQVTCYMWSLLKEEPGVTQCSHSRVRAGHGQHTSANRPDLADLFQMPPHGAEERHLLPDKPETPGIRGQLLPRGELLARESTLIHVLCKILQ